MRYIDSGFREPRETLGSWLSKVTIGEIVAIRWQTGFFSAGALGLLAPMLEHAKTNSHVVRALIGANDHSTTQHDVRRLFHSLGMPRANALLGVVSFSGGAFFHPKVVHLTRRDGSELAYVGSANLTGPGLSGQHVEAGILLDTNDGDGLSDLKQIRHAIDRWFEGQMLGFLKVETTSDIDHLVTLGILAPYSIPRSEHALASVRDVGTALPKLSPLLHLPPIRDPHRTPVTAPRRPETVTIDGFPSYFRFAKNHGGPTSGSEALTADPLPENAAGLIFQLNKDNARHFLGQPGTANISIPVATASTIRFGRYGKHLKPRAEFPLMIRYIALGGRELHESAKTSVMGYGYTPTETGNRDIRMVVPASVKRLNTRIAQRGDPTPSVDDVAILEWPTRGEPVFRLTFLAQELSVATDARARLHRRDADTSLPEAIAWLPKGLSPQWG